MSANDLENEITKLYRQHATMLRHTCRRILGDAALAEDITQESFIQYIDYAARYPVQYPGPVLYRIATRLAVKKVRARKDNSAEIEEDSMVDDRPDAMEQRMAVMKILRVADEDEAQIAIMHFVEGLSHDEIGEVMEVSRRTIGNRLERFCRRAAKLIAPEGSETDAQSVGYEFIASVVRKGA